MKRLKGTTILIGKQAGEKRLSISFNYKGSTKTLLAGEPNSVPDSVSRYKPTENTAHCSIEIGEDGETMILSNLNPQNKTFVNGVQIMRKAITRDSKIELGFNNYPLDLNMVFNALQLFLEKVDPTPYSISHLEEVWNEYNRRQREIKESQIKNGKYRLIPIIIGSLSGVAAPILSMPGVLGTKSLFVTIPIAVISFIFYIIIFNKKDDSIEKTEDAKNYLIDNYVCPKCHHTLGFQDYKILKQNTKCPYCQCKFKTE